MNPEILSTPQEHPEEIKDNEICMNIASLLPMAVLRPYVEYASRKLMEFGYGTLCVLPLRGLVRSDGVELSLPVHYIEPAWNPTERAGLAGLLEVLRGGPEAPQIHDFVAFHNKYDSSEGFYRMAEAYRSGDKSNPTLTEIVHKLPDYPLSGAGSIWVDATILEIHPGLNMSAKEILDKISVERSMIPSVDIDTRHIRRGLKPNEIAEISRSYPGRPVGSASSLGNWEDVIRIFSASGRIGLVDFQAMDPNELQRTLDGYPTELNDVLNAVLETEYRGPIRVEFNMGLLRQVTPGYAMGIARDSHDYLRDKIKWSRLSRTTFNPHT